MQAHSLSNRAASTSPCSPPAFLEAADGTEPSAVPDPGLVHDAGNLLAALRLYADLLAAPGVLRPEHAHYAGEIGSISCRSTAWVDRALHRETRTPRCPDPTLMDPYDGAQALRTLSPLLVRLAAPHAHVAVHVPAAVSPLPFTTDVLERLTLNLVCNAAAAIGRQPVRDQPGDIRVALRECPGMLQLSVEDNGPGMRPSEATRLVQTSSAKRVSKGLGLGIVRDLARATAACIEVRVAPRRGTTITLSWRIDPVSTALCSEGVAC